MKITPEHSAYRSIEGRGNKTPKTLLGWFLASALLVGGPIAYLESRGPSQARITTAIGADYNSRMNNINNMVPEKLTAAQLAKLPKVVTAQPGQGLIDIAKTEGPAVNGKHGQHLAGTEQLLVDQLTPGETVDGGILAGQEFRVSAKSAIGHIPSDGKS